VAPLKLNEIYNHRKQCFIDKRPCLFGCGKILKGIEDHLRHAETDCPKVETICQNCDGNSLREDEGAHDCVPNLINKVDSEKSDTFRVALDATRT